jgi:hypothetical protein
MVVVGEAIGLIGVNGLQVAVLPLALHHLPIGVVETANALPQKRFILINILLVVHELAFVSVAIPESIDSIPLLDIRMVLPLVRILSIWGHPYASSSPHAVDELPLVGAPIRPRVGALPRGSSLNVLADIGVPVLEAICTEAVLQPSPELSLIAITVEPSVNAHSVYSTVSPFSYILIPKWTLPQSTPILHAIDPLSVVDLPVTPTEYTPPMPRALVELPLVHATVAIAHQTPTVLLIAHERTLV